jgi:DNA-binding MarR family transcriptional regulator
VDRTGAIATWERLARFHRSTTNTMDAHLRAECGRSLDDYDVLHQIRSHEGPIRMGDLARRLLMANSSCTRIVGRLVDDGLLSRRRGADDHREVLLELTSAGRRQWRRMAAVHTRDIERSVGTRLTERQQVQLDGLLRRLLDT